MRFLKRKNFIISIIVLSLVMFSQYGNSKDENSNKMQVNFHNIESDTIKKNFITVFKKYNQLHKYKINVYQKNIGATTMKAQPVISFSNLIRGVKEYKIVVGESLKDTDIKLSSVPSGVLQGWFAHELGHVSDYEQHSNMGMLWYAIKYVISKSFKKKVEHTADYIALKKGFKKQLLKTKRYILLSDIFSEQYLININQYYLSIKDVEDYIEEDEDVTLSKMFHE